MKLAQIEEQFTEFLVKRDLKYTSQRRLILREAHAADSHFTADELIDLAKSKDSTISKATLYRTLGLLTESGVLEEHDFGSGRKNYEFVSGRHHHDHLICTGCDEILEFESEEIERLQDAIAKKMNFTVTSHTHKLYGLCQNCAKTKE